MPARLPRLLHPGAWWLWALGLAAAAGRTTNPLLLGLIAGVAGYVVAARRPAAPWARAFGAFLRLGLVVVVVRVVLVVLVSDSPPGHVLVTLPSLPVPSWAAGVRIGGAITVEAVVLAAVQGAQLAVLLACIGAANSLAGPTRLLRSLPGALYETGVAVVVALSFAPQAIASLDRVRAARRLRGRDDRGLAAVRGMAMPVLTDALDRSVRMAAAMDSRGFGRPGPLSRRRRRATATLTVGGLLAVCVGLYGLLDTSATSDYGLPMMFAGTLLATAGLLLGGRRSPRTVHRPDPWAWPEWVVSLSGMCATVGVVAAGMVGVGLQQSVSPLTVPLLPWLPTLAVLVAILPAWVAPPLPAAERARPPVAGPEPALAVRRPGAAA